MTVAQWKTRFEQLQALDIQAGKIVGNADHVRAQKTDGFSYALDLGTRIFMLGLATSFLALMLAIVFMLGDFQLNYFAGIGFGFLLIVLTGYIYPSSLGFRIALMLTLGIASIIGLAGGLHGVSADILLYAIDPRFNPWFLTLIFSFLIAGSVIEAGADIIKRALTVEDTNDDRIRRMLLRIRRSNLLMLEEKSVLKEYAWAQLWGFLKLTGGILVALIGALSQTPLGFIAAFVGILCAVFFGWRLSQSLKAEKAFALRVIERAKAAGFTDDGARRKSQWRLAREAGLISTRDHVIDFGGGLLLLALFVLGSFICSLGVLIAIAGNVKENAGVFLAVGTVLLTGACIALWLGMKWEWSITHQLEQEGKLAPREPKAS